MQIARRTFALAFINKNCLQPWYCIWVRLYSQLAFSGFFPVFDPFSGDDKCRHLPYTQAGCLVHHGTHRENVVCQCLICNRNPICAMSLLRMRQFTFLCPALRQTTWLSPTSLLQITVAYWVSNVAYAVMWKLLPSDCTSDPSLVYWHNFKDSCCIIVYQISILYAV